MQELIPFIEKLTEYTGVLFFALILVLFIVMAQARQNARRTEDELIKMEGAHREIIFALDDRNHDAEEQLAKINSSLKSLIDETRQQFQNETETLRHQLAEVDTASKKQSEKIHSLFEQQGVFLHDRFGDIAASEQKRTQEIDQLASTLATADEKQQAAIQQQLTQTLGEQSRRIEAIQATLTGQTDEQNNILQQLRQNITSQVAELMLKERSSQQEGQNQMTSLISVAMERLASEVDAKLSLLTDKVSNRFSENLANTMQSFSALQSQIDALIAAKDDIDALGQDVTSLTRLVLSKSGGGITSGHLPDMLAAMLPNDSYILNPMVNGHVAAAQLMLPGEQGAVIIDSSFPTQHFDHIIAPDSNEEERMSARTQFDDSIRAHINKVADNFIAPPTTGTSALLFIPSEVIFAEIQAHHKDCVSLAAERQVWLVSPTTLAAALNMARSALKDEKARAQLEQMRQALQQVAREAQIFEARLLEIGDHVNNAMRSVQRAESAGVKLFGDVRDITGIAEGSTRPAKPALPDNHSPTSSAT